MDFTYQQALDYLYSFVDYESMPRPRDAEHYDLRRMDELLERLGNPHHKARTVHIAGTKGKGSTAAMIASVLTHSGYRTGLFTSPHLHTFNERIRIDGGLITDEEITALVNRLQPEEEVVNEKATYGKLTTFELITVLGFMYFALKQVDFQVVEVGLGGRLDATNVVQPDVSVITTIGFDHMEVLGNTIPEIAAEKAGIIRQGGIVVSSSQVYEAEKVITRVCSDKNAQLIKVGTDITYQAKEYDINNQKLRVNGRRDTYEVTIPLIGDHQLVNAATAVATLEVLAEKGFSITKESIGEGLARVNWPGRLQLLSKKPLLVVDGAHTPESARKMRESLEKYFSFDKAVVIIGSSSDKDISGIVEALTPLFTKAIITRSIHPRSMPADTIEKEFRNRGVDTTVVGDFSEALPAALSLAGENDLVCATGSLFIVAGVIEEAKKLGLS
ncbi:MAG: bifunctional folylpolyglutamate synthase/dihydrofolate synthase [Dehalococcoidales bacterium]|nr:MAG: bifunctional folylpolyglutamate synthase/dihydrofolate synthase [Dehalococcoidales bacterium]